ncbi:MAG: FAD-binding oxidoreductase [Rubrivivax sp.]
MDLLEDLHAALGAAGLLTAEPELRGYRTDSTHAAEGGILAVVRPANTAQAVRAIAACRAAGVALVVRGGGTGFAGGCLPLPGQQAVVMSLERMNRIRSVDAVGNVLVAEAGCTLARAQEAARAQGRLLGLDHGGAGSSTLGGNVATNAGGNNVVRYGMAREQLLGIEAVLADGSVIGPPATLRKSNAGYEIQQLIAGSEGTLAVITAVALKMRPAPVDTATAVLAVDTPQAALALFGAAQAVLGETISAFELMSSEALEFHYAHVGARRPPFDAAAAWTVLLEADSASPYMDLPRAFHALLEAQSAKGLVRDGSVAASLAQRRSMWALREGIAIAMGESRWSMVKTDTAVPVVRVPEFIERSGAAAQDGLPGVRSLYFGHVGDGNIHLNLLAPPGMPPEEFRRRAPELSGRIDEVALALQGTVSAEHGIGQGKREALRRMRTARELGLMAAIKDAFDPAHLLNPGKIFACTPGSPPGAADLGTP